MDKIKLLLISVIFSCALSGNISFHRNDSILFSRLDSIKVYLDKYGVVEPYYVLAQAAYETGWFNCKGCTWQNNNMFGFKGLNGKYMKFSSWKNCVLYYSNWQKKRYPKFKEKFPNGTYLEFIKWSRFATAQHYTQHIKVTYDWILAHWAH